MIAVLCENLVKKENQAEFINVALRHADISCRTDKGCVRFDVLEADEGSDKIVFLEIWEGKEYLDAHAKRSASGKEVPLLNTLRYGKKMEVKNIL